MIAIARLVLSSPRRPELAVLLLDRSRHGDAITVVERGDDLLVEVLGLLHHSVLQRHHAACVLVSMRPGGGVRPSDELRWPEADVLCAAAGLELIDWLVIGRGAVWSVPEVLGAPSRW